MRNGFTLIELMIVVAIIAIIMSIALPSYSSYKKRVDRADVQTEMMNIAQRLESHKLANYKYPETETVSSLWGGNKFPQNGTALYTLDFDLINANTWVLKAEPISTSSQKDNGVICLNDQGQKFWAKGATVCALSATSNWDGK